MDDNRFCVLGLWRPAEHRIVSESGNALGNWRRIRIASVLICILLFGATTANFAFAQTPRLAAEPTVLARVHSPVPILNVRLSKDVYRIKADPKSGAPIMPRDIVATATLEGWPAETPQPTTFTWHVFLDWDVPPYPTHHSISGKKFEQFSPFQVNLAGTIRGGRLKIIAKTNCGGHEIVGVALAIVAGDNPPRAAVLRAFPPNRLGMIASKIATAESAMQQFDPATGMPMLSRSGDVGMMQLNAPTYAVTSEDQVWDWRANLVRGLEMMNDKRRVTSLASRGNADRRPDPRKVVIGFENAACINFLRWYLGIGVVPPPGVPPLSSEPGSGILPGEADPDHLALTQLERDAIRRYNGGSEYTLALATDPGNLTIRGVEWRLDPTRGGVRARSGDPDYVGHVLRARSGFVIPKSGATSKVKHRRARSRRRTHK